MLKTFYSDGVFHYPTARSGGNMIVTSLYGSGPQYCHNALRYALSSKIHFPEWGFRVYIEMPERNSKTKFPKVPAAVLCKLKNFGTDLVYVNASVVRTAPQL